MPNEDVLPVPPDAYTENDGDPWDLRGADRGHPAEPEEEPRCVMCGAVIDPDLVYHKGICRRCN